MKLSDHSSWSAEQALPAPSFPDYDLCFKDKSSK